MPLLQSPGPLAVEQMSDVSIRAEKGLGVLTTLLLMDVIGR